MLIAISGSSGFIGKALCGKFSDLGYEVIHIRRRDYRLNIHEFKELLRECDVLINLSGSPILHRWTPSYKKRLISSRIDAIDKLLMAMKLLKDRPRLFISASAVGIYDSVNLHSESSQAFGNTFLTELVKAWESKALTAQQLFNLRVTIFRFGVVLGKNGGAFPKMALPFKIGMGGKIGNGRQMFPFVHIEDVVRSFLHVINNMQSSGIYNIVAPDSCTNRTFAKTLGKAMRRPSFLPLPKFVLRLIFGKASMVVSSGQHVKPQKLLDEGFQFRYANITDALNSLV